MPSNMHAHSAGRVGFDRDMGALDSVENGQGLDASDVLLRTTEETTKRIFSPYRAFLPWDASVRVGKKAVRQFRVRLSATCPSTRCTLCAWLQCTRHGLLFSGIRCSCSP